MIINKGYLSSFGIAHRHTNIRCLLRLNEVDINEADTNEKKVELIDESLRYISKVLMLSSKWFLNTLEISQEIKKELEWLIQSSWNQAVEAENCNLELSTCLLFEQTAKLVTLCNQTEYIENLYICYYFSIKYRIKLSRENKDCLTEYVSIAKNSYSSLSGLMSSLNDKIEPSKLKDLKSFLILSDFEMELLNENWEYLSKILDSSDLCTYPVSLLKSMAGKFKKRVIRH